MLHYIPQWILYRNNQKFQVVCQACVTGSQCVYWFIPGVCKPARCIRCNPICTFLLPRLPEEVGNDPDWSCPCPPPSLRTRSLQRNITTWNWSGITSVSLAYITSMTSVKTSQQGMIVLLKLRLGSDYNSMSSLLCPVLGGVWTGDWIRNIRLAEIGSNENTHLASVLRHLM